MSENFRASTWFITGATGLVGSTVVEELCENDLHVMALVRENSPPKMIDFLEALDVKLIYGDILEPKSYENFLPACDVVVHTAAAVEVRDKDLNWTINLEGTRNICQSMRKMGLKRLIHISTAGVYGKPYLRKVDETVTPKPYGPYLKSKYAAEKLIREEFQELNVTMIRPPFIFGEIERDRHVYTTLVDNLPRRILPRVWRHNPKLGFVHAEDIARMVLQVGSMRQTNSQIYNIQSFSVDLNKLYGMVSRAREVQPTIIPIPYTLFFIGAAFADIYSNLTGSPFGYRQRVAIAKTNWIFSMKRARKELDFHSIHRDPHELERLMSSYYEKHYDKNGSMNMIEMMQNDKRE